MIPDRARPWLEAALYEHKRPLWTMADLERELEAHEAHLWVGERSCVVTVPSAVGSVPERAVHVWLAGGDLREIVEATPRIEAIVRDAGCTQVTIEGRKGWVRALAPLGYEYQATVVRKLLT